MLSTYQPSPEQKRQHEAHKARLKRLCALPARKPKPLETTRVERLAIRYPDIHAIVAEVARKHAISCDDVLTHAQGRKLSAAQCEALGRSVNETKRTNTRISVAFNIPRTTVREGWLRHDRNLKPTTASIGRKKLITSKVVWEAARMRRDLKSWKEIAVKLKFTANSLNRASLELAKKDPKLADILSKASEQTRVALW